MKRHVYKAEQTSFYKNAITKYLIESESDKFVTLPISGRREAKETSSHKYCDSFIEAKEWAMYKIDIQINNYQSRIDSLKSTKQNVNNIAEF